MNDTPTIAAGQAVVLSCWSYEGTHAEVVGPYAMSNVGNEWVVRLEDGTTMAVPARDIHPV